MGHRCREFSEHGHACRMDQFVPQATRGLFCALAHQSIGKELANQMQVGYPRRWPIDFATKRPKTDRTYPRAVDRYRNTNIGLERRAPECLSLVKRLLRQLFMPSKA